MQDKVKIYPSEPYDVIVVGAGHAGVEAALAAARMGQKTMLMTIHLDKVAFMPCNPAIGGPAKGIVVREVDALGGEMGRNTDKTYVQMRMLNTAKGPAVRALRAQSDKNYYSRNMKKVLEETENLTLRQGLVNELIVEDGVIKGIITSTGARHQAKAVVLTTGTSSRGEIVIGELKYSSGPDNTLPSVRLSENLLELGFELDRFQTSTPPRIHDRSIHYEAIEEQPGHKEPNHFSFETPDKAYRQDQLSCWLTYTNEQTHQIIQDNLDRTYTYSGEFAVGPRYCPTIEDKIVRFHDKPRHLLFLEPEGDNSHEIYVQGMSTAMPEEVQLDILRSIKGLEDVELMRTGYAIEYDIILPHQLRPSLETKLVHGLFSAGQINGTSGYEEAAGQGIIAGINAARYTQGKEPYVMKRNEGYIGVMIDDLVTKGTVEPYRLLTSRAEYRLLLRHDNADFRLTEKGHELGLVSDERYERFLLKKQRIEAELERLTQLRLRPKDVAALLEEKGEKPLKDGILAYDFLRRPNIQYAEIAQLFPAEVALDRHEQEQIDIRIKYEGYIEKSLQKVEQMKRMEDKTIPSFIDYHQINSLKAEAVERLEKIRPETIAQASRISGVTPADIAILSVYIEQGKFNMHAK
ncbi:tRNA uridine-5-carboxymethylaminomethyl(34) synthesis enzyme MnmG [Allofustis seminis]|uniref:tRNA uridine-5-carboxymethylaminomethyl(34) synthesis enzyme MnmG n=1 Tax=Allofustis seminis TaxID=166939 RepID=UPI00037E3734|nr:tRNA uridine-5-carboxymethylaminomethyl(34) synthesis enzyme MnmG [Allofustis seminis]